MTRCCAGTKSAHIEENTKNSGEQRSNTTPKQRGGITGKGFVPGDPRINRKGRPKSFDQCRELAQQIAHEELTTKDGTKITVADAILRKWARGDHQAQKSFMEMAFGKVPDKIETTGLENKTTLVLHFDHERADGKNGSRLPPSVSLGAS